jgi:ABC-type lipoprotein export system ATPase subunit
MLSCRKLSKTYETERGTIHAVQHVDLDIATREYAVIVGRSGSGKSSLMAMIGGLSRPSDGTVEIGGNNIWTLGESALAAFRNTRIGFVFQFSSLLGTLRLIDNVALPAVIGGEAMETAYRRAGKLLCDVGLGAYLDAYPGEISSGEQRRAAIARALINRPDLILADEPTSDLDEQTEQEIMALFRDLNRDLGATLVLITHNLALAEGADRVFHVANGKIV